MVVMSQEVKILFKHTEFNEPGVEGIWAKPHGEYYILDNIPFYVRNYALGDIISAILENEELYANSLIQESGNSVVRVLFSNTNTLTPLRQKLKKMGCASELSNLPNLIAIDIPPSVSYRKVITELDNGEKAGDWEYEEGCISNLHKEQMRTTC